MSESHLPVPDHIRLAPPTGVYPGTGALPIDAWTSLYLDQGIYWLDWLTQRQRGQTGIAQQLLGLYAGIAPSTPLFPYEEHA